MPTRIRAVALLAAVCLAGAACSPPPAPSAVPPSPTVDAPTPDTEPRQPSRPITLAFAGDVHFQLQLTGLLKHPRTGLGRLDRLLGDADVTMVNLESAVTERGTLDPKERERPADRYWYRTTPAALDLLAAAGVDVVTVANNHGADYGQQGLADTLRAAVGAPVAVVGLGHDRREAFTPHRVTVRGTRLAFLAADASFLESGSSVWRAGAHSSGLAAAHGRRPAALLHAVRSSDRRGDVVVVYLHWGAPMESCPTAGQQHLARMLSDAGADVVVGAHSHVLEGAGWLTRDTYVDYGLGNAVWYHDGHPDGGVLQLRLRNGQVEADRWLPALVPPGGGAAVPLRGPAARGAVAGWRSLRGCAGLAAGPTGGAPAYSSSVHRIGAALRRRMRDSRGPGCPVPWRDLRLLRVGYIGFDGHSHRGEMVVASAYADDVASVFGRLYAARWPIRRMRTVDRYDGDDDLSMAADNTSGFNCRRVAGTDHWSDHAFGAAIDLDPRENPYVRVGHVSPARGRRFSSVLRSPGAAAAPGVVRAGDVVVRAFAAIGWEWGGRWAAPDYQHFSPP